VSVDAIHTVGNAIDASNLGAYTGALTAVWGVIRVTAPIFREWLASRRTDTQRLNQDGPTFRAAFEVSAQKNIDDHKTWDHERAQLLDLVQSLERDRATLIARIDALEKNKETEPK
jgi:hypothetical protein